VTDNLLKGKIMTTENFYAAGQRQFPTLEQQQAWYADYKQATPLVRLAAADPADEDELALYVDQMFAGAGIALRGAYQKPIKRGRGRPRKDDQNVYA
jgi:hypothetical protein